MRKIKMLEELKERNQLLAAMIDKAERDSSDDVAVLKRELYSNKIAMLDIINQEDKRAGLSARELRERVKNRPTIKRHATGVKALDFKLFGGIEIGTFVQLAGQSGIGKTHLTLEILSNVAREQKTVFFNFEMGDFRIVKRLEKLFTTEQQWDNLIIDKDSRHIDDLAMEIVLHAKDGVKFFVIDSKMKILGDSKMEDHKRFAAITKKLSELSQTQEVIIFLINQMSEEDIKNKRLAFKGSGDQQYDSDISLFYVMDTKTQQRKLICNKNRQDEELFMLELDLDQNGRTVSKEPIVTYQEANGRYTGATVTTYEHREQMSFEGVAI